MLNVLIIEDDAGFRDALAAFLLDDGCRVLSPADVAEAAAAVQRESFDLILCDYRLRELDGLSFLVSVKERQPGAVKILMTGFPGAVLLGDARRAGIDDVVCKQFIFENMQVVKTHLDRTLRREAEQASV